VGVPITATVGRLAVTPCRSIGAADNLALRAAGVVRTQRLQAPSQAAVATTVRWLLLCVEAAAHGQEHARGQRHYETTGQDPRRN